MTTTTATSEHEAAHRFIELTGDITDYWSYTQVRDWVFLHPDISPTAMRLYLLLRSMVTETARRSGGGLRRMSLDQLCWLLPGVNGKATSLTRIKDALRNLDDIGLVTNPDGGRLVTSGGKNALQNSYRRYQVNDLPPDEFTGWRNPWDKLDAYTPDWRENPPEPPTHIRGSSTPVRGEGHKTGHRTDQGSSRFEGRISDRAGRKKDRTGRKKIADEPLTSENARPKEVSPRSSSLSPAPETPPAPRSGAEPETGEREGASPRQTSLPEQRAPEQGADGLREAEEFVRGLPGQVGRRSVPKMAAMVAEAITEGWTYAALRSFLTARCDVSRVHSPEAIYARHLDNRPAPPAASLSERRKRLMAARGIVGSGL